MSNNHASIAELEAQLRQVVKELSEANAGLKDREQILNDSNSSTNPADREYLDTIIKTYKLLDALRTSFNEAMSAYEDAFENILRPISDDLDARFKQIHELNCRFLKLFPDRETPYELPEGWEPNAS